MHRKQPIINERKNTKADAKLDSTQQWADATDKNTKDNVNSIKWEREDISLTIMNNRRVTNMDKIDTWGRWSVDKKGVLKH